MIRTAALLFFASLVALSSSLAQLKWQWLHPRPQSNQINYVKMWDANTWYMVGASSTFMKTTDAGLNWTVIHNAGYPQLSIYATSQQPDVFSAWFFDQNTGILACQGPGITRTTNGGATWDTIRILPTTNLGATFGIYFLNSTTGFVCGNSYYNAYKTTNGGLNWTPLPNIPRLASGEAYYHIYAADENNIFVANARTAGGMIVHTSNAGATWDTLRTGMTFVNDIEFASTTNAYACGGSGGFAFSLNGGLTWTARAMPTSSPANKLRVIGSEVYVTGDLNKIYKTTNNGATWDSLSFVDPSQSFTSYMQAFDKSGNTMVVAGGFGMINSSSNNGTTWTSLTYYKTISNFQAVFARKNSGTIWAAGDNGTVFYSTDGGNVWSLGNSGTTGLIRSLKMIDGNLGYFCGDNGILGKTTDGGKSWTPLTYADPGKNLYAIDFVTANTGWVVGGTPPPVTTTTLGKTTDGGATWVLQTLPSIGNQMVTISMLDLDNGWASSNTNQTIRTTNGGTTWLPALMPTGNNVNRIKAFDINTAITTVQTGPSFARIFKTTNGGSTWDSIPQPYYGAMAWFATDWTSPKNGIIAGASGLTAKTTDGGQTWSMTYLGGNMTARDVIMTTPDTAFCVTGSGGTITGGQVFKYAGRSGAPPTALTGPRTVGGTSPDYPTIKAAIQALNQYGTDVPGVTFLIRNGTYNEDSLSIHARGSGPDARITFKPDAGANVTINVTPPATAYDFVIGIDSTSFVTIDGQPVGGSLTQRGMTLNSLGTAGRRGVYVFKKSTDCVVRNVVISCAPLNTLNSRAVNIAGGSTTGNPDNCLIENVYVRRAGAGVYISGATDTVRIQGATVQNCEFSTGAGDTISYDGMWIEKAEDVIVKNNIIRNMVSASPLPAGGSVAGILVTNSCPGVRVDNNDVSKLRSTGSAGVAYGIAYIGAQFPSKGAKICNNFVSDVDGDPAGTFFIYGLVHSTSGAVPAAMDTFAYNSVNMMGSGTGLRTSAAMAFVSTVPGQTLFLKNNVLKNTRQEGVGAGSFATALRKGGVATNVLISNNNDLYVGTPDTVGKFTAVMYNGTANLAYSTLADWRTGSGQDANSIAENPPYLGTSNLHIDSTHVTGLDGRATPIASITTDIDSQPRNLLQPDIGADEFSRTAATAPTISAIGRSIRVPAAGDSVLVSARILDSTGVGVVADSLWYSINGIPPVAVALPRISGTNTDGVYRGVIPGSASVNGYRVEYQIMARGANSTSTLTPISATNSYFAGISPLSITGVRSLGGQRQLLYAGYYVKVTGTINGPNFQTTNLGYFFQDAVGGINLFKSGITTPVLALGDSIIVTGKLDQFRGLTEVTPDTATLGSDIVRVAAGRPVPVIDLTVSAFNANPENYEGRVIRLAGLLRRDATPPWPAAGNDANIVVYQAGIADTIIARIDRDTEIPGSLEPVYPATFTGVTGQFTSSTSVNNDGYQIQPRYLTDVGSYQPNVGWTSNTSGTTAVLYAVKSVNQLVGWIAGGTFNALVTVLRTVNGGEGWASVGRPPVGGELYAVEAVDANMAFVVSTVASTSHIYRTINGGTTWAEVFSQPGGFIDAIKMYDATSGIAIGDPVGGKFTIVKTTDGGATWARIATEPSPVTGEAAVNNTLATIGTNNIWFGSSIGNVYRSTDGGATWAFSSLGVSDKVNELAFNGTLYGVAGTTSAFRTTDGGVTWMSASTGGSGEILGISATGDVFWLSQGSNVYRSSDHGATWAISYSGTIGPVRHLDFTVVGTSVRGWAVSSTGGIAAAWFPGVLSVKELNDKGIPVAFALDQNYPNPFNPTTTIHFALPKQANITLRVYNILGQEVATLVDDSKPAGYYEMVWNGHNQSGNQVSSGVYFYRIEAKPVDGSEAFTSLRKMLMLK